MILTCPHCASRFKVFQEDLGTEGRKVQCSDCRHVWFALPDGSEGESGEEGVFIPDQDIDFADESSEIPEPDYTEVSQDDTVFAEEEVPEEAPEVAVSPVDEDIPEAVKPRGDDAFVPERVVQESPPLRNVLAGYGAAGAVFLVLLLLFVALQGPIVRNWPPASAAYALIGRSSVIPGEGLVFDRMEVFEDNGHFVLGGNIINLTKDRKDVPLMEVVLRSQFDEFMDRWYIEPPQAEMGPEESMAFESSLQRNSDAPAVRGKAAEFNVRFVLAVRTASAGGDSTRVLPADDPSHPNGGEAPSESPEHASSQPHPESSQESHGEGHSLPPLPRMGVPEDHSAEHH